jgi:tRNA nucleotidyltransferase (CCA-adding enzyme)
MADYIYSMETRLTPDQQRGVNLVQEIARRAGLNLYLTGGSIRDLITGFPIRDIDLSIQGNPLKLQKDLEKAGITVQGVEGDLRALHLLLPGNVRAELNLTRSETYDKPGKPPVFAPATIHEDLRRRDFTVNAMALSLNPGSRGLLLDPFNGIADIEAKVLRVLHSYAFLEDPVRLIRATRLSTRFHWPLEERTQARYESGKENNYVEYVSKRSIGAELEQLAHEEDPLSIMRALEKEGWLKLLHPHWSVAKAEASDLGHAIKLRQTLTDLGYTVETGPLVMYFLTRKMSDKDIAEIQRMIPRRDFVEKWKHLERGAHDLTKKLTGREAANNSGAWKILSAAAPENILFLSLTTRQQAVDQKLKNFLNKWRQVREKLPYAEMAEMRITAQLPEYPKILDEAFLLLLDGKLRSHNEIVNFLKPYEPPPPPPPPAPKRGRGKAAAVAAEVAAGIPAVAATAPLKRGRKPKVGATAVVTAVGAMPATPAETAKPVASLKAAKSKAEPKVTAPVKEAAPAKKAHQVNATRAARRPATKAASAKAKPTPAKKVQAKKSAPKKPVATKSAPRKHAPGKTPKKKR